MLKVGYEFCYSASLKAEKKSTFSVYGNFRNRPKMNLPLLHQKKVWSRLRLLMPRKRQIDTIFEIGSAGPGFDTRTRHQFWQCGRKRSTLNLPNVQSDPNWTLILFARCLLYPHANAWGASDCILSLSWNISWQTHASFEFPSFPDKT